MHSLNNLVIDAVERLDHWIEKNCWAGYDPYDIQEHRFFINQKPSFLEKVLRKGLRVIEPAAPLFLRKLLNIKKRINAKAMGLFGRSYLDLYKTFSKESYLIKAKTAVNWIKDNYSRGYSGMCWGYPFDWDAGIFIPKNTPSAVVSAIAGDAFWGFYNFFKDDQYLKFCESICEFFINDLKIYKADSNKSCFSYTPIDSFHVNNANLFVAEFLIRVGKEVNNAKYIDYGLRAVNYTLSEQNEDGSICYWGKDQQRCCHIDHYHSGFEIRSLYSIWKLTANQEIYAALKRYYKFYLNRLFTNTKIPKLTPESIYPVNIHSCAEAILCTCMLIEEFPEGGNYLNSCLKWTIKNMQDRKGWFIYMIINIKGIKWRVKIPYMRWAQAWMLRGLSQVCAVDLS